MTFDKEAKNKSWDDAINSNTLTIILEQFNVNALYLSHKKM